MRPLLASFLAVAILLPSLAYFAGTAWHREISRKAAKQVILTGLPVESLFRISLPIHGNDPAGFHWVEEGEFRYKGMMYDVVSQQQTADSLILLAWADLHETVFETEMEVLMARLLGSDPMHNHLQQHWSHFLKQLYPPTTCLAPSFQSRHKPPSPGDDYARWNAQCHLNPPVPPPELIG